MGLFNVLISSLSESTLTSLEEKMREDVDALDDNPEKQIKIDTRRLDIVNELSSRRSGKLPKSENGWYLSEDE